MFLLAKAARTNRKTSLILQTHRAIEKVTLVHCLVYYKPVCTTNIVSKCTDDLIVENLSLLLYKMSNEWPEV